MAAASSSGAAAAAAGAPAAPVAAVSRGIPDSLLVYSVGRPAFHAPLRDMTRFADLRVALQEEHQIDMREQVLVDEYDNIKDYSEPLRDNTPVQGVAAKQLLVLTLQHDEREYEIQVLHNSTKSTWANVKAAAEAQLPQDAPPLAPRALRWKGRVYPDHARVDELDEIVRASHQQDLKLVSVEPGTENDPLPVVVQHAGYEYQLSFGPDTTILQIRTDAEAQRETGASFHSIPLTWKGVSLTNEMRVADLPDVWRGNELELRLIGHKTLVVLDLDMGDSFQAELNNVSDSQTLAQVLNAYQAQQRRYYLHQPLLARYDDQMNADSIGDLSRDKLLDQGSTVYDAQLATNTILALKTQMFEVVIKEQSEIDKARASKRAIGGVSQAAIQAAAHDVSGQTLAVFDWWRVRQLKETYSTAVTESLGPTDQLYMEPSAAMAALGAAPGAPGALHDELDDGDKLYKYGIREGSVLIVKREDFTQPVCLYTCADCGSDVRLKQRDFVRCRECGHRIVFKKRITKACQYLCR